MFRHFQLAQQNRVIDRAVTKAPAQLIHGLLQKLPLPPLTLIVKNIHLLRPTAGDQIKRPHCQRPHPVLPTVIFDEQIPRFDGNLHRALAGHVQRRLELAVTQQLVFDG